MRKIALSLWMILLSGVAHGQQVTAFPDALLPLDGTEQMYLVQKGNGKKTSIGNLNLSGPILYATAYGVKADGTITGGGTPNDVALKNAVNACSVLGATLILPPGLMLLNGSSTVNIRNCNLVGAGNLAGGTVAGSYGSMFTLTSTSVKPFVCGNNWGITGINFYWPNQTGGVVYPPLLSDSGTSGCSAALIQSVVVVNAYDVVAQTAGVANWGDWMWSNVQLFAAHDVFRLNALGDAMYLSNVRVLPGAWLAMGGSLGAVGTASNTERVLHVTDNGSSNGAVNFFASNFEVVGARYGVLLDAGATLAESGFTANWDAVGTIIDTSSGGNWAAGIKFTGGSTGCAIPATTWGSPNIGNAPCFNFGATGTFQLTDFHSAGSQGDFVKTSGTAVILRDVDSSAIASINDGSDYAQVNVTAGNPEVTVLNSKFSGNGSTTNNQRDHVHGIYTGANAPNILSVQGSSFIFHHDNVSFTTGNSSIVSGNSSQSTRAASLVINGGGGFVYQSNNAWDTPSNPVIASGFGTSPSVSPGSDFRTFTVNVGTGGSISSGVVTLPYTSINGYACNVTDKSNSATSVTVSTPNNATQVTLTNYSRTTGLLANWAASDLLQVTCSAS